jgi:hypothetical protein
MTIDLNGGASPREILFGVLAALVSAVYVFNLECGCYHLVNREMRRTRV